MNVILILCDTWRRDHIGAYGAEWIRTPNADRLAARGTVFDNFYFSSFPTLPCRRDIATGRIEFPWRAWGGLDPDDVTLSQLTSEAGLVSYFLTDVFHHWCRDAGNYWRDFAGFDLVRGQEADGLVTDSDLQVDYDTPDYAPPARIAAHFKNKARLFRDEADYFSPQVFQKATRWIEHNAAHEDFFLMIDCFDPHEPWDPPRYYANIYDPDYQGVEHTCPASRAVTGYMSEAELRRVKALYAGEITLVDRWLGYFLDQVELLGLMDNTMIVLTSDHGTYLGDFNYMSKQRTHPYGCISRVPLIVWHPDHGHGQRRPQLGQHVDLFPTILEAVGLEPPADIHGKSLTPVLRSAEAPAPREALVFGQFCYGCNVTDGEYVLYHAPQDPSVPYHSYSNIMPKWHSPDWGAFDGTRRRVGKHDATKGFDRKTALYHLPTDPGERKDLSETRPDVLERMLGMLADKLAEIDAPPELFDRFCLRKAQNGNDAGDVLRSDEELAAGVK